MAKKINISQKRKDEMKISFSSLQKSSLIGDEKRYYQLIENGKNAAKNTPKIRGRYLSGNLLTMTKKFAANNDLTPVQYVAKYNKQVTDMYDKGYTALYRSPENLVADIDNNAYKTVTFKDNKGRTERVSNEEAALRVVLFQQFMVSNFNVVWLTPMTRYFENGRTEITLPTDAELVRMQDKYESLNEDEQDEFLNDFLDDYQIEYGKS